MSDYLTKGENICQWTTKAGLPALVVRIDAWDDSWHNGYVGIPPSNPLYGLQYIETMPEGITLSPDTKVGKRGVITLFCGIDLEHPRIDGYFDVHGGITFTGTMKNEISDLWWVGFDCHHLDDDIEICNVEYVKNECEYLAKQIIEATNKLIK